MKTHTKPTTALIAVRDLSVLNERAQRLTPPNRAHVEEIKQNFDPRLLGMVQVSPHNGSGYHILDGRHRVTAVRELFGEDTKVWCIVQEDLRSSDEAFIFAGLNNSLDVKLLDRFVTSVEAGDPVAVGINNIMTKHGLVIGKSSADGHVTAVASLRRIYEGTKRVPGSPEALDITADVLIRAWGRKCDAFKGDVLLGVGLVVIRDRMVLNVDRLSKLLASTAGGPEGLLGTGRTIRMSRRGTTAACVAEAVVDIYNVGLRTKRLAPWRS